MNIIDEINKRLFDTIETWLPDARKSSQGYQACNPIRGDTDPGSMTIYTNGRAMDFAANQSYDCINLFAAQNRIDNKEAIKYLSNKFNLTIVPKRIEGAVTGKKEKLKVIKNTPQNDFIFPPEHYPASYFAHNQYGSPSNVYSYYNLDNKLIGYTCRFDFKNGTKVVLPFTYSDTIGKNKDNTLNKTEKLAWHWNAYGWINGWPIYGLEKLNQRPYATVVIVEGEKTCDAAQRLLPDCVVLSWAGGVGKANKVNWSILQNRNILIWPDADLKKDKVTNEFLPKHQQPGMKAAIQIAQKLENEKVKIIIPPVGLSDGWDLADAENEDWNTSKVLEYIARSSFTEEELEKEFGVTWRLKQKIKTISDELLAHVTKNVTSENFKIYPLVVVTDRLNYKGEIKKEIDVPATIENYLREYIETKFTNSEELVLPNSNEKTHKKNIVAKRSYQIKTYKSLLTQIWCECNSVLKKNASRESIENYFANILEEKREKAFLDLQDKVAYDETNFEDALRITTIWLAHGLTPDENITEQHIEKFKPQALALLHFIWQVKRKLYGYQAEMHMAPILLGEQGNGKSELIRNIAKIFSVPFGNFVKDAYVDDIGEEKNEAILAQSLINILDEMAGAARAEMNKVKNFISRHKVNPREFHTQRSMGELINLSTFICAANVYNLSEILHDESGNRRFFPIKVHGFIHKKYSFNGDGANLLLEKFKWIQETGECFPYNFDSSGLWKIVDHLWPCFIRTEEVKKIQSEHRYEPIKQWLENFQAEVIPEEEFKRLQMKNEIIESNIELVSIGFLRELFLSMFKMNPMEVKKWSIQKFSLELNKIGIKTWKNNARGKYHKYMVCALRADWSQIDQKFKDRLIS